VQNGPGSPAPGSYPQGVPNNGKYAGIQATAVWALGEVRDNRPICSQIKAEHLWRLTVLGENVLVDISYGTLANKRIIGLRTPVRITVPGSLDVYARAVIQNGILVPAHVEVTCTPVTSGGGDAQCRQYVGNIAATTPLDPDACRFVALEASTLRVGPADGTSITVTLAALQAVSLIAGSALLTGGGFVEFEP
jgi:hypothetical protein